MVGGEREKGARAEMVEGLAALISKDSKTAMKSAATRGVTIR